MPGSNALVLLLLLIWLLQGQINNAWVGKHQLQLSMLYTPAPGETLGWAVETCWNNYSQAPASRNTTPTPLWLAQQVEPLQKETCCDTGVLVLSQGAFPSTLSSPLHFCDRSKCWWDYLLSVVAGRNGGGSQIFAVCSFWSSTQDLTHTCNRERGSYKNRAQRAQINPVGLWEHTLKKQIQEDKHITLHMLLETQCNAGSFLCIRIMVTKSKFPSLISL